jgi:phosphomannomutase
MWVDPTQPFPREAEPKPEVLGDLATLVREKKCDIGFAQDPDGDRLAVVDERGNVLDGNDVLGLAVDAVLSRLPGDVVVNLTTSSVIADIAARHGRRIYHTPVGEANVVERMRRTHAVIGGEGANGGIIFPAVQMCRDSYTGMAFLLDRMAATGLTVSQLVAAFPRYARRTASKHFEYARLGPVLRQLEERFPDAQADRTDGLKLLWPGAWVHVRASNTEPLLRLTAEATSDQLVDEIFSIAERIAS